MNLASMDSKPKPLKKAEAFVLVRAAFARRLFRLTLFLLVGTLAACEPDADRAKTETPHQPGVVYFHVSLHSYLEPAIFDVMLNGIDIGASGGQPSGGPGGVMVGVPVPLGKQEITWRLGDSGDTVHAANTPVLTAPANDETYLGVHIYPDNTVELVAEKYWPEDTAKGAAITRQWIADHGLAVTGCAAPIAELGLTLPPEQQKQLIFAADRVLFQVNVNFPVEFGPRKPYVDKCRFVAATLITARDLGLSRLRDLVNFVALTLSYHERMQSDAHFAALLDQLRQKRLTMDQVLKQWDTTDTPVIISVRSRDIDDTPLWQER